MKRVRVWVLFCVGLLSGCICETIDCKKDYGDDGEIVGQYHISSFAVDQLQKSDGLESMNWVVTDDDCNQSCLSGKWFGAEANAVPLEIKVRPQYFPADGRSSSGFNLLASALTLMIVPLQSHGEHWEFEVCVSSPVGKDKVIFSACVSEWGGATPLGWVPALFSTDSLIEMGNSPTLAAELAQEKRMKVERLAKNETVSAIRAIVCSSKYKDFVEKRRMADEEKRRMQRESEQRQRDELANRRLQEQNLAASAEKERKAKAREMALRDFALTEAPQLWQTIQSLKAEKVTRKAALEALCKEMKDFGRDPDTDPDVASLRAACDDLDGSLVTIYGKLEEAYIAYKKMQATPGHKEYADMMKAALEDGIQEADATAARYREMSRDK